MAAKVEIPLLDKKTNFSMWQVKMRAILAQMELEDALFEEMPRRWTDERWSKCNRKALTQIHLHLSNEILRDVHKETSAYKLWLQLEEICMAKTVTRRMLTKQRLFGLRMLEGTSLELHISKFKEVISDLEAMDANTLIEEDLCCLLLMSLPASYTAFRDTLFYGHKDLSLRTVYESLSSKEIMNHMANGPVTEAEGLVIRGRDPERKNGDSRGRSKSKNREKTCNYCKKKGHIKSECYKFQNKNKRAGGQEQGQPANQQAEVNVIGGHDSGELLAVSDGESASSDDWILDSACTFHIFQHYHAFTSYTVVSHGTVVVGNGTPCKVQGIGNVQIRMFDGTIRTFGDVRHVPDLKRNLISLSTLDSKGYKFVGVGGVLKVLKGALVFLKGHKRYANLYVMEGSTVLGDAAVPSSTPSDADITKIWHMRLGHMSQQGMDELSRRGLLCGQCTSKLDFCEHCVFGKQTRVRFSSGIHSTKGILDYIHSDFWGPSTTPSHGGAHYMLTFTDDFSRKVWVYFLKHKSEAFQRFKEWMIMVEKQTGKSMKNLRTDNGLEFCSNDFNFFCNSEGIRRHLTVRHTP